MTDTSPATPRLDALIERAELLAYDLDLKTVTAWKEATGGHAAGHFPVYTPRELLLGAGFLPVALFGGGDRLEIIRGDAYFQSYICHLPRSAVELLVSGRYGCLDAFIFPSTCDVIRNLSGIWQMMAPEKYVKYLDLPQFDDRAIAARFYGHELRALAADLARVSGKPPDPEATARAIAAYNRNYRAVEQLLELRRAAPWLTPTSEVYLMLRAGSVLPVDEHTAIIHQYTELARQSGRREMDHSRVVVVGAFCEQPPLGLIKTLERAGCYVVGDDLVLGLHWLRHEVSEKGDPIDALVDAYLDHSVAAAVRYIGRDQKGRELIEDVRQASAEGVIFCAASFCDPALLDQPMLANALTRAGIPYASFKYSEDTGQFAVIREQAGTFADSIRLWSEA